MKFGSLLRLDGFTLFSVLDYCAELWASNRFFWIFFLFFDDDSRVSEKIVAWGFPSLRLLRIGSSRSSTCQHFIWRVVLARERVRVNAHRMHPRYGVSACVKLGRGFDNFSQGCLTQWFSNNDAFYYNYITALIKLYKNSFKFNTEPQRFHTSHCVLFKFEQNLTIIVVILFFRIFKDCFFFSSTFADTSGHILYYFIIVCFQ